MELIERKEVLSILYKRIIWNTHKKRDHCQLDKCLELIEELPTVESRPKGKWVKEIDYKVMGEGYMWNCSECGNRVYVDSRDDFPNYCDECGADMRDERVLSCDRTKCHENEINDVPCEECECCADTRGKE